MKRYPNDLSGLPKGVMCFMLHAADGAPIAITDTRQGAMGHAIGDELTIEELH